MSDMPIRIISIGIIFFLISNPVCGYSAQSKEKANASYLTVEDLERLFPGVPKKQISIDQYLELKRKQSQNPNFHIIQEIHLNSSQGSAPADTVEAASYIDTKRGNGEDQTGTSPAGDSDENGSWHGRINFDISDGFNMPSGGGDKDAAVIVFVVIGLVVAIVMVVAGAKIIYDTIKNPGSHPMLFDFEASYSYFRNRAPSSKNEGALTDEKKDTSDLYENGRFVGCKLTLGLINVNQYPALAINITGETGSVDVMLDVDDLDDSADNEEEPLQLTGVYGVIGPNIRIYFDYIFTYMLWFEVLMGTTEHKEVGVLSLARVGFDFGGDHFHIGLHYGAVYLQLKEAQGFVRKGGEYNEIQGVNFGLQF